MPPVQAEVEALRAEVASLPTQREELAKAQSELERLLADLAQARTDQAKAETDLDGANTEIRELERKLRALDPVTPGSPARTLRDKVEQQKEEIGRLTLENERAEARETQAREAERALRERLERDAVEELRDGIVLVKHSRRGGPSPRVVRVTDGRLSYQPISALPAWTSLHDVPVPRPIAGHEAEKAVRLRDVLRVLRGRSTANFARAAKIKQQQQQQSQQQQQQPAAVVNVPPEAPGPRSELAVSLICASGRTVDLVAPSRVERDRFADTIERLMASENGGGR
jgi:hypothetical protein